jgi:hypothetical protein
MYLPSYPYEIQWLNARGRNLRKRFPTTEAALDFARLLTRRPDVTPNSISLWQVLAQASQVTEA